MSDYILRSADKCAFENLRVGEGGDSVPRIEQGKNSPIFAGLVISAHIRTRARTHAANFGSTFKILTKKIVLPNVLSTDMYTLYMFTLCFNGTILLETYFV